MTSRIKFTAIVLSFGIAGGFAAPSDAAHAATDIQPIIAASSASLGQSGLTRALAVFDTDQGAFAGREGVQLVQRSGRSYRRSPRARDRRAYRDRRSYRSRRGLRGRDVGIGIGAAIIGGIVASQAARADRQAMLRCDARFRSFDWETGTYVTYGGDVRVCPYLR